MTSCGQPTHRVDSKNVNLTLNWYMGVRMLQGVQWLEKSREREVEIDGRHHPFIQRIGDVWITILATLGATTFWHVSRPQHAKQLHYECDNCRNLKPHAKYDEKWHLIFFEKTSLMSRNWCIQICKWTFLMIDVTMLKTRLNSLFSCFLVAVIWQFL